MIHILVETIEAAHGVGGERPHKTHVWDRLLRKIKLHSILNRRKLKYFEPKAVTVDATMSSSTTYTKDNERTEETEILQLLPQYGFI